MAENKDYITCPEEYGSVNISEDVIATIVGAAVTEVEGIAGFATSFGNELAELFGKKGPSKGVKITIAENEVAVDAFVLVQYGAVISDVGKMLQDAVASAIEAMTGIKVTEVNVNICGVSFEKNK